MKAKEVFYLSSDHAGYDLKEEIKNYLLSLGFEVVDLGPSTANVAVSYSEFGRSLAEVVSVNKDSYGIGVCGTGLGMTYAVNRFKGIRGARITSVEDAKLAKQHNDANILTFGGRQLRFEMVKQMIDTFLATDYEGGRHQERINDLDK